MYWSDTGSTGPGVYTCPVGGCPGSPTLLASVTNDAYDVAVDGTNVYWVELLSGNVMKCAIGGCGGKATVVASAQNNPSALALDAKAVYWVNYANPGAVMKVAK